MKLYSVAETIAFGKSLTTDIEPGAVIALTGDLGAGKTHLVKGIALGAGSTTAVTSPTFTIIHEYADGRLPVFHIDLYRLNSEDEAVQTGIEEFIDGAGITVVEWADKFPALMPAHTRWIHITIDADEVRNLTFSFDPPSPQ